MLLGKINGATREDSSIFFLTNSNDTTSKFVIKVCNHLFTLNFYITEVSHVVQVRAEGPKAPSPGHRPGYNGNQQCAL